jgi:hypothetical protein
MTHRWLRPVAVLVVASFVASGCNTIYPRYMGIRPDSPTTLPSDDAKKKCGVPPEVVKPNNLQSACLDYRIYVEWADQLAQSYSSRATMNEWSIYLAGTIALGALSAVAGLGLAAAAATTTIGLIGVSSGFASGFFAMFENRERAGFYAEAANQIREALNQANQKVVGAMSPAKETGAAVPGTEAGAKAADPYVDPSKLLSAYVEATKLLSEATTKAANMVEQKRYEAAAAAATAAKTVEAKEKLQELTALAKTAMVVDMNPLKGTAGEKTEVTVKTKGIEDLAKYRTSVKILADGEPVDFEITGKETLKVFMPPRADGQPRDVVIRLWLGDLPIVGERTFKYEKAKPS